MAAKRTSTNVGKSEKSFLLLFFKKEALSFLTHRRMRIIPANDLDLSGLIRPGQQIVSGQACGEPLTLLEKLAEQRAGLAGSGLFIGASFAGTLQPEHADHLNFVSFGALGTNRRLARAGKLGIIPCHVAQLGPYFTQGAIGCDVLLVQLSPQGRDGRYSFGATADYIRAAATKAKLVIAEINDQAPRVFGDPGLTEAEIDIAIFTSRPLPQVPAAKPAPTDEAIAAHAANFINDNAVLQMGIGATPDAILRKLTDRRNLGFHSGMMSDAVVDLINAGVITNATKPIDPGISITGALIGTDKLYRFAHDNPALALHAAAYTHAAEILARLPTLVTINSAIEVDLSGQINAEQIGEEYVGGIGGQADYVRAGHRSEQGHAIIALPSSATGGISRIVKRLTTPTTTQRADADIIITEYGAAELKGCTLTERGRRLIAIAHPAHREALQA
jgi:acyl-CoA hydrolase